MEGRKTAPPKENTRRADIEHYVGEVPMPDTEESNYLLSIFFEFGPVTKDGPVTAGDVLDWAKVMGVRFKPWQARMFIQLSRAYCGAQHESTNFHAPPPWPGAEKMWQWVRAQQIEQRTKAVLDQEIPKNGNRQRRRDPAPS